MIVHAHPVIVPSASRRLSQIEYLVLLLKCLCFCVFVYVFEQA